MKLRTLAFVLVPCVLATAQRPDPPNGPRGGGGPAGGAGTSSGIVDRQVGGAVSATRYDVSKGAERGGFYAGAIQPMPPRPNGAPKVTKIEYYTSKSDTKRRVVIPPALPRCTEEPSTRFWGRRDLMEEIKWLSRVGFLPVTAVDAMAGTVVDHCLIPSGWKAYGFAIPSGGKLQVELQHAKLGWFRLVAIDKWGQHFPGMVKANLSHQPVVLTISNPKKEAEAVYVIVDDPAWWSTKDNPYTLVVRRDWDPAVIDLNAVKMVAGLWGGAPTSFVASAQYR